MTIGILAGWTWWGAWYPWAEANQGLLGLVQGVIAIVALVVAIVFFLAEQRRANKAEKDAQDQHRATELLMIQQVEREAEIRVAAVADDRFREVASYVDTLSVILRKLVNGLRQEIIRHEHLATSGSSVRVISSDNRGMALTVGQALSALLPSAPRDPALIMAVHAALIVTAQVGNWNRGFESSEVADHVKPMADQLDQVIDTLNERLTAHQPPLR